MLLCLAELYFGYLCVFLASSLVNGSLASDLITSHQYFAIMQQNRAQVSCAYELRGQLYVLANLFRIFQHRNDYPVKIDVYRRKTGQFN